MRSAAMILVVILFTCVFSVNTGEAQEEVQSHIRHVMESSSETPREMGLLTVALSEVAIAREHAGYAAGVRRIRGTSILCRRTLPTSFTPSIPRESTKDPAWASG